MLDQTLNVVNFQDLRLDGYKTHLKFSDVLVVAHIHVLPSFADLVGYLVDKVGLLSARLYLVPKPYSTIKESINDIAALGCRIFESNRRFGVGHYDETMYHHLQNVCDIVETSFFNSKKSNIKRVLLLDDGGMLTEVWSKRNLHRLCDTVSIQQTSSGVHRLPHSKSLMKINVGGSAAKRHFESKVIASGMLRKVATLKQINSKSCLGIVGYGALGSALAAYLRNISSNVLVYDYAYNINPTGFAVARNVREIASEVDFLFGCTGRNIFHNQVENLSCSRPNAMFYSCSSRDVEFKSVIQRYGDKISETFGNVRCHKINAVVANGGFPVNFDRTFEWETPEEISLTRGLILIAIFQAMCVHNNNNKLDGNVIALSSISQMSLVSKWLRINNFDLTRFSVIDSDFFDRRWWDRESLGEDASHIS